MKKYKIELTLNQLKIIESTLNLYLRIGIGQFGEIAYAVTKLFPKVTNHFNLSEIKTWFETASQTLFKFQNGENFGIAQKEVSVKAKDSYDMIKTIQKVIAAEEKHHKHSVWHNGNILKLGKEPLIKIEEVK